MAKVKVAGNTSVFRKSAKVKRKGIHSKSKSAKGKSCKNYLKKSRGQG